MSREDKARTLKMLKKLQDWQLEIIRLEREIELVPGEIKRLQRETEEGAAAVVRAEDALKDEQKRSKKLELDLEAAQGQLSHFNDQILKVKTNEQLWALQKEIEFSKNKISDLETRAIESMERLDEIQDELETAKQEYARLTRENKEKIEVRLQNLEKMKEELEQVRNKQKKTHDEIDPEYIELFECIQEAKGGLAVAIARDGICQACNYRIRPQIYIEVRHAMGIYQCDNCRRVLYYEEEPPLENPAELS